MWRWGCLSAPPQSAGTLLLWHFLGSALFDYTDCDGLFWPEVCFKSHQEDCLSKDQSIMLKVPYYGKFTMPIFANNNKCPWLVSELGRNEESPSFISSACSTAHIACAQTIGSLWCHKEQRHRSLVWLPSDHLVYFLSFQTQHHSVTEVRYIVSAAGWRQRAKYDIFLICVVLWLNSGGASLLERRYKDLKGFIMSLLNTCIFCIKKSQLYRICTLAWYNLIVFHYFQVCYNKWLTNVAMSL